ncbi:hypothetical protein EW146_g8946 [Bondarzewia mesenterica]|uniref:Mob1/phocein n=1 Tax=Bondarzewia mesenterica TaxID=1095465 RepID=A0A4S4LC50_9AGAM|nr:hypothetical protein EW146_g8946 [Bondarzewia mesenterica]
MSTVTQRPLKGSRISTFYPVKSLPLLSSLDSAFQLQEYISLLIRLDIHDVEAIVSLPDRSGGKESTESGEPYSNEEREAEKDVKGDFAVDEACWIYEQLRRLAQDLSHPLITMLQQECTRTTCPEMKAGEWLYLCVAHGNDGAMEQCCAIDYILHTVDSATALLNSPRAFPSRLSIPQSSHRHFSSLARRLGRIFAHAYFHHREVFEQAEAESALYARFLALTSKFDLVPPEFLVIPQRASTDEDVEPPRLHAAAVDPQLAHALMPEDAARGRGQDGTFETVELGSGSPPERNPSPWKGRNRTGTMVHSEAFSMAEELAKGEELETHKPALEQPPVVPPALPASAPELVPVEIPEEPQRKDTLENIPVPPEEADIAQQHDEFLSVDPALARESEEVPQHAEEILQFEEPQTSYVAEEQREDAPSLAPPAEEETLPSVPVAVPQSQDELSSHSTVSNEQPSELVQESAPASKIEAPTETPEEDVASSSEPVTVTVEEAVHPLPTEEPVSEAVEEQVPVPAGPSDDTQSTATEQPALSEASEAKVEDESQPVPPSAVEEPIPTASDEPKVEVPKELEPVTDNDKQAGESEIAKTKQQEEPDVEEMLEEPEVVASNAEEKESPQAEAPVEKAEVPAHTGADEPMVGETTMELDEKEVSFILKDEDEAGTPSS